MNLETLLHPKLILCDLPYTEKAAVLREMAEHLSRSGVDLTPGQILEAVAEREKLGAMPIGRGLAFSHVRTDKTPQLRIGLALCPQGISDLVASDDIPVKLIVLFLIPRIHSDLYLKAMALLISELAKPDVMEKLVVAKTPEEAMVIMGVNVAMPELTEVGTLFSTRGEGGPLGHVLGKTPPGYVAELLEDLKPDDRSRFLGRLDPVRAAEIIERMHLIPLSATIRRMAPERAAQILSQAHIDKRAQILRRLKPDEQAAILKFLAPKGKREVQAVLSYPPSSAGGIMTVEVLSANEHTTVEEALQMIAGFKDKRQTELYVVSDANHLLGKCLVHDLLAGGRSQKVSEIMKPILTMVQADRDQEDLRHMVTLEDTHSIPVVGPHGTLLGIVTEDDVLKVVEHEANEDLQLLVGGNVVDPIHTPTWTRARLRMPWLFLGLAGELFIALVITKIFQATLQKAVVLAAFIPAIMATGGNVGMQSTTMIVRGLGMGTLKTRHTMRILWMEVRLGAILGFACGLVAAGVAYLINWNHHEVFKISISVMTAMMSATLATSLVGVLEPLILYKLKFDPATACGPFVTMFNDIFGSCVYLLIAMFMNFTPPAP